MKYFQKLFEIFGVWEEIIIIGDPFRRRPNLSRFKEDPEILIGNPNFFIETRIFFSQTQIVLSKPPIFPSETPILKIIRVSKENIEVSDYIIWISNENIGFSDENIWDSDENIGSPMKRQVKSPMMMMNSSRTLIFA